MAGIEIDDITEEGFNEALREFLSQVAEESYGKESKKHATHSAKAHVQTICNFAYQEGLPTPVMGQLLYSVIHSNSLDQGSRIKIIKSLYPNTRVPSDQICMVVSSLGPCSLKPSLSIQDSLLRWIIMVHEFLEEPSILSNLYSVFFNMLDMLSLRQQLFDNGGREPALNGLMRVFECFCTSTIFDGIPKGLSSSFSHLDPTWRDRLRVIQQVTDADSENDSTSFKFIRRGPTRICLPSESEHLKNRYEFKPPVSLEAICGVEDFVNNLEMIKISTQMVSAIDESLLQWYLLLDVDKTATKSTEAWLTSTFEEQLSKITEGQSNLRKLSDLFHKVLHFTCRIKTLPRPAEDFFQQYLPKWNGKDHRDIILDLLSYVPARASEELQLILFTPLEAALLDNTATSSIALLEFYTRLLRRWTAHLLTRSLPLAPHTNPSIPSYSADNISGSLISLSNHISILLLSMQTSYPSSDTSLVTSSILTYLESLTFLISHAPSEPPIAIPIPHPLTIYLLVFIPSMPTLSRLCTILATYKAAFEATLMRPIPKAPSSSPSATPAVPRHTIGHFNGFLMDICNLLWRSRAFNTNDANAFGCLLPSSLLRPLTAYVANMSSTPQALGELFSLSLNPTLAGLSNAAWREIEDRQIKRGLDSNRKIMVRHTGPVSQRSLTMLSHNGGVNLGWTEYRIFVLRWLAARGVGGVGELMGCTMKGLMGKGTGDGIEVSDDVA